MSSSNHEKTSQVLSKMRQGLSTDSRNTTVARQQASRDVVVELFARLSASYGRLFTKSIDGDNDLRMAMTVWGEQSHGLSPADIAVGVDKLPKDFPPSPFQFRDLCKPVVKACHKPFENRLPAPRNKQLARQHLADAAAILRGGASHGG